MQNVLTLCAIASETTEIDTECNREEIKDIHGVVADWVGEKVCCLCAREGLCPSLNLTPKCLRAFQTTLEKRNKQV